MEHLRKHPNFIPLPKPSAISNIQNIQDINQFRQGS